MSTPSPEGELSWYLRNALRSEDSAELLKQIADAATVMLGTTTPGGTAEELDRALAACPPRRSGSEPLERNARFAAVEFALSDVELDILLLALRLRRGRQLGRFCNAVHVAARNRNVADAQSRAFSDAN